MPLRSIIALYGSSLSFLQRKKVGVRDSIKNYIVVATTDGYFTTDEGYLAQDLY